MFLEDLKRHYRRDDQQEAADQLSKPSFFPGLIKLRPSDIHLQLFAFPSFDPLVSWTIYKEKTGAHLLRRVSWNFTAASNIQILSAADALLDDEEFSSRMSSLGKLSVPVLDSRGGLGLDGITYGLRINAFSYSTEITWWCDPPPGAELLGEWYHSFIAMLEASSFSKPEKVHFRPSAPP